MKRGFIIFGVFFALILISTINSTSALASCRQGGYTNPIDCRYDDYSCLYAPRCVFTGPGACLSPGCEWANFNEYSCKTRCSIINGVPTCFNCAYDQSTGMCTQAEQCDASGTFCLPGLRKCSSDSALRQFCDGTWTTEEDCSSKGEKCSTSLDSSTHQIVTQCIVCNNDKDNDGYLPAGGSSPCPVCTTNCDCDDSNPNINPGAKENCTNKIDDNCNGLVDNADPACPVIPIGENCTGTNCTGGENGTIPQTNCSDTDGGYNINVKGVVTFKNQNFEDYCIETGQLIEYSCLTNSMFKIAINCSSNRICSNGSCVLKQKENETNCSDTLCIFGVTCSGCRDSFWLSLNSLRISIRIRAPPTLKEMNVSSNGLDIIKEFECFKSEKYICPAGKPTIGYGHVIRVKTEKLNNVFLWNGSLTKEQATNLLKKDVKIAENAIKSNVKVNLTQNQYDALTSFVFNIGVNGFKSSTLLKKLNTGDYKGAAEQLPKWNKGGGKVLNGLIKRRASEKKLFETDTAIF